MQPITAAVRGCPSQKLRSAVAVVRHAERADAVWGHPWNTSADAARFPYDPPITCEGMHMAAQRAKELTSSGSSFDILVSSPYLRAVQTALIYAEHLNAIVILDHQLGELLGPDVFGAEGPAATPWRTWETLMSVLEGCSEVPVNISRLRCGELLGEPPKWPESRMAARTRYAARYLTYLRRARRARMSCLLVTHGHMMQASLRVLPATSSLQVESVGYCATMMAQMYTRDKQVSDSSSPVLNSATVDEASHKVGEGLAHFLDGREWGRAEPPNDSTLQNMALCWWEASVSGLTYHGDEDGQHPSLLAKLQQHLDWNWHHIEGLLGVLRPLQEAIRPSESETTPRLPEPNWCRLSSIVSDGGEFKRFASDDSFCRLIRCPTKPTSPTSSKVSPTSPTSSKTFPLVSKSGLKRMPVIKPMAELQRKAEMSVTIGSDLNLKPAQQSSLARRRADLISGFALGVIPGLSAATETAHEQNFSSV